VPTVTVISAAFAPLARVVAEGANHFSLPIVVVPHPVGDPDEAVIARRGEAIARECARLLTTPTERLQEEFRDKRYPLSEAFMPR
jgi:hypothetical protein